MVEKDKSVTVKICNPPWTMLFTVIKGRGLIDDILQTIRDARIESFVDEEQVRSFFQNMTWDSITKSLEFDISCTIKSSASSLSASSSSDSGSNSGGSSSSLDPSKDLQFATPLASGHGDMNLIGKIIEGHSPDKSWNPSLSSGPNPLPRDKCLDLILMGIINAPFKFPSKCRSYLDKVICLMSEPISKIPLPVKDGLPLLYSSDEKFYEQKYGDYRGDIKKQMDNIYNCLSGGLHNSSYKSETDVQIKGSNALDFLAYCLAMSNKHLFSPIAQNKKVREGTKSYSDRPDFTMFLVIRAWLMGEAKMPGLIARAYKELVPYLQAPSTLPFTMGFTFDGFDFHLYFCSKKKEITEIFLNEKRDGGLVLTKDRDPLVQLAPLMVRLSRVGLFLYDCARGHFPVNQVDLIGYLNKWYEKSIGIGTDVVEKIVRVKKHPTEEIKKYDLPQEDVEKLKTMKIIQKDELLQLTPYHKLLIHLYVNIQYPPANNQILDQGLPKTGFKTGFRTFVLDNSNLSHLQVSPIGQTRMPSEAELPQFTKKMILALRFLRKLNLSHNDFRNANLLALPGRKDDVDWVLIDLENLVPASEDSVKKDTRALANLLLQYETIFTTQEAYELVNLLLFTPQKCLLAGAGAKKLPWIDM